MRAAQALLEIEVLALEVGAILPGKARREQRGIPLRLAAMTGAALRLVVVVAVAQIAAGIAGRAHRRERSQVGRYIGNCLRIGQHRRHAAHLRAEGIGRIGTTNAGLEMCQLTFDIGRFLPRQGRRIHRRDAFGLNAMTRGTTGVEGFARRRVRGYRR